MATKENKRQVRELVEGMEQRIHCGPAIRDVEIQSARDFLRQHDFPPASDYFDRLAHIENQLQGRPSKISRSPQAKRNYGGEAGGYQMQVQSIFDHVILSTCYAGNFNTKRGKVKISHRFNQEGRIDFIELKFLYSLHPLLNGELRKLLTIKDYPSIQKDWYEAEAFVLRVLPQELVFLYEDILRCPRTQLFAWLLNIGHGIVEDLLEDLNSRKMEEPVPADLALNPADNPPNLGWPSKAWNEKASGSISGNGRGEPVYSGRNQAGCTVMEQNGNSFAAQSPRPAGNQDQLPLDALLQDEVARPILEKAAGLESVVEEAGDTEVLVRYTRKSLYDPRRTG
jgi:hypothetical protein